MLSETFLRDFFNLSRERARRASRTISWNRTLPVPENVNFKEEALTKIREQIRIEDIDFIEDNGVTRARLYVG